MEEMLKELGAIQFDITLDNLTIVGRAGYRLQSVLGDSLLVKSYWQSPNGLYMHNYKMENGAFLQIDYKEDGNVRLEFNPNKFRGQQNEKYLTEIIGQIVGADFSRRDIAVDLHNLKMNDYYYLDLGSRSLIEYKNRKKELETVYMGSADSDERMRGYNKAIEQGLKNVEWVRIEAQLRREKARALYYNPFEKMRVVKKYPEEYKKLSVTEKMAVTALMADESLWSELDKKTRKKYKELLSHKMEIVDVSELFQLKVEDLASQADSWLNFSRSKEGGTVIKIGKTVLADREEDLPKVDRKAMECSLKEYLEREGLLH